MRALMALVVAIVMVAGSVGLTAEMQHPTDGAGPPSSLAPTMAAGGDDGVDDAAHFKYYQNDSDISRWYEWWYLNVKTENGHSLLIEFFTFGDLNNPFASAVGVVMLFMHEDGSTYKSLKSYPGIPYSLSYETCDVSITGDRFVQRDDGTFERRDIQVRRSHAGRMEVTGGLDEGEQVVTQGGFALKSDMLSELMTED